MSIVVVDGVELIYETAGHPNDPVLLLLSPPGSSSDRRASGLSEQLAAGGRYVIRYADQGPVAAENALALLAELDHHAAHLVGIGHGAQVAITIARNHPDRVETLTVIGFEPDPDQLGAGPALVLSDPEVPAILRHTGGDWDAEAGRLARRAHEAGNPPTAWFDRIYQAGDEGRVDMPWDRSGPHDLLTEWLAGEQGRGRTAVVVGCGLGADAEFLAGLGWDTVGFDVAPSALRLAEQRNPGSRVKYRAASLFALPSGWRRAFDLVVEIFTVQALPRAVRSEATTGVASLVAPGGRLLVVSGIHGAWPVEDDVPPWPLTEAEVQAFAQDGLETGSIGQVGSGTKLLWRGVFHRPAR